MELKKIIAFGFIFVLTNGLGVVQSFAGESNDNSASGQKWSIEYDTVGPNVSMLGLSVNYNFNEKLMVSLGFSYLEKSNNFQSSYFDLRARYNLVTDENLTRDYFEPFVILGYAYLTTTQLLFNSDPPQWDRNAQLLILGPGCEFLFGKQFGVGVAIDGQLPVARTNNIPVWPAGWDGLIVDPTIFFRFRF